MRDILIASPSLRCSACSKYRPSWTCARKSQGGSVDCKLLTCTQYDTDDTYFDFDVEAGGGNRHNEQKEESSHLHPEQRKQK